MSEEAYSGQESRETIATAIEAYNFLDSVDEESALCLNNGLKTAIREAKVRCILIVCAELPQLMYEDDLSYPISTDF